jgi:ferredoxin-NADP reductase
LNDSDTPTPSEEHVIEATAQPHSTTGHLNVDSEDPNATYELVVERIDPEADGVVSVVLTHADGVTLPPWQPGAHIDFILTPEIERQYSLSGDPADGEHWRLGILREPEGRGGSQYVHDQLKAGDTVEIRGPRNNFPFQTAESYIFIAGGIGITPILTMVREAEARGASWRLIYGGRQESSMAFREELAAYGDKVTVWPQDRLGLIDLPGLLGTPVPGCKVYCCGPEPLIDAVEANTANWPAGSLHVERFRPRAGALDGEMTAFEVYLDYSELTLAVTAEQSIAEAIEAAGIEVMTSCREGTCGTCETPVLEGIPDHRDSILTADERAANDTMMICCSRSLSPRLVLDL